MQWCKISLSVYLTSTGNVDAKFIREQSTIAANPFSQHGKAHGDPGLACREANGEASRITTKKIGVVYSANGLNCSSS